MTTAEKRWLTEDGERVGPGDQVWITTWQGDCATGLRWVTLGAFWDDHGNAIFADRDKGLAWCREWARGKIVEANEERDERVALYNKCLAALGA